MIENKRKNPKKHVLKIPVEKDISYSPRLIDDVDVIYELEKIIDKKLKDERLVAFTEEIKIPRYGRLISWEKIKEGVFEWKAQAIFML